MWIHWIALSISYLVTGLGQVALKMFAKTPKLHYLFWSIALFVIAPFTTYVALRELSAGTVYVGAATSQIIVILLSRYALDETITRDHLVSMSLILGGLILFALGSGF